MKIHGQYRLSLCDAAAYAAEERKYASQLRDPNPANVVQAMEEIQAATRALDTGWLENIVTDSGRRYLIGMGIHGGLTLFIHAATPGSNVRRDNLQFTYTDGATNPQVEGVTVPAILDGTTLLQTRITQFGLPSLARTINCVGLTVVTAIDPTQKLLYTIVSYTKLTSTVVQATNQVANLQHRLTWSLD